MRILIVGNFASAWQGNRAMCEDMADSFSDLGWSVVKTSGKKGLLPRLGDMLLTTWRSRREYDVAHVDVFSGRAFAWAEAVCRLLRLLGKPYVLTLRGGGLPEFARTSPARVRRLLSSAESVTTPSRFLLENMLLYRPDLRLLPNPLDLRRYSYVPRPRPRPRLVWLRAFHYMYNPPLAVRVMAAVARVEADASLVMVGPDKGDGSLQEVIRTAAELRVAEKLTLPGGVKKEHVAGWLDKGDIFLNTTNVDNTPVSVMEAMACGLCVVSTNVGGIPYLLEHEQDALLVPPDDEVQMAAAVQRILHDDGLAERLSLNARAKAEGLSWRNIISMWEELFRGVASAAGARTEARRQVA